MDPAPSQTLSFGAFTLEPRARRLRKDGRDVELRSKSFDVLVHLASRAGEVVSKDQIFGAVWRDVVVTDDSLVQCIGEIRQALDDREQRIIRTVPRRGYLFTSNVTHAGVRSPRARVPAWTVATIASVIVAGGAAWWLSRAPQGPPPPLSIVVMPLSTTGEDAQHTYLADWITEDITSDLSRIPSSFVIASSTASSYKDRPVDARAVGRELGVRYLLVGNMRRIGEAVRISLGLVEAQTAREIWSDRFDASRREIELLPDKVTSTIARELHLELMQAESKRSRTLHSSNPDADDLALQGWALHEQRTPESVAAARELLVRAVAMDPQSVFAWSFLSNTYTADVLNRWMHLRKATRDEWARRGEEAADRAYALDATNLYALEARATAMQVRARHEEAVALLEKAIALNRNYAPAWHRLAYSRGALGDFEGCVAAAREALRLSPRDGRLYSTYTIMSAASLFQRHDEEALEWAGKAVQSRPDFGTAHAFVAAALAHLGRMDEARKALAEFKRLQPGYTIAKLRAEKVSDNAAVLAGREHFFDGLRKAGLQ